MGGVHAGLFRIHKAHKVDAHLVLGFSQTSIHGSRGPFRFDTVQVSCPLSACID